jgi:hypothetical protein
LVSVEEAAIAAPANGSFEPTHVRLDRVGTEAALERARAQVEALAQAADELQSVLPERLDAAIRDGMRAEALPVARQLAEVRGLAAQLIRRCERIETELAAERRARVEDLGLLVDLISSGWRSVDERLARIEAGLLSRPSSSL